MSLLSNSWVKEQNHNKTTEAKGPWERATFISTTLLSRYMCAGRVISEPTQACARSRRSTSQQRWVACKILDSSLISEGCSNCCVCWLPSHKIRICLFYFVSGMLWEWNPLLKHQALRTYRDKDDIHRFFLLLSEPRMYSFELFNSCVNTVPLFLFDCIWGSQSTVRTLMILVILFLLLLKSIATHPLILVATQSCHRLL